MYYLARYYKAESKHFDWILLNQNFAIQTVSIEMVIRCVFLVTKVSKFKLYKFGLSAT